MSLNIKSERAHTLARQAALSAGISQTAAVEKGLELLLRELGHDPQRAEAEARQVAARRIAAEYSADTGTGAHLSVADLYDERTGLPR